MVPSPQRAALAAQLNPFAQDWRFKRKPSMPIMGSPGQYVPAAPAPQPAAPPLTPEQGAAQLLPPAGQQAPSAPGAAPTQPSPTWRTNQFAAPQYIAEDYNRQVLGGWDPTNWADPNMQTPKYVVGRILSKYPPNVNGLRAAMPEIQRAYPGAEWNGKDGIRLPTLGNGWVDVGRAFSTTASGQWGPDVTTGWQWLTEDSGAGGSPQQAGLAGALSGAGNNPFLAGYQYSDQDTLLAQLMAQWLGR